MDIFRLTSRPDNALFYRNQDLQDVRLGSIVKSNPLNYHDSTFVLLGCPQDDGVVRNGGRAGTDLAPQKIRERLFKLAYPQELEEFGLFDLGDIILDGDLEEIHNRLEIVIKKLLEDKKIPIIIGGGHDITYPSMKSMKDIFEEYSMINIDSNFGVRKLETISNDNPIRFALEEQILVPNNLVQIGSQQASNSYHYRKYLDEMGIQIQYQKDIRDKGLENVLDQLQSQFGNRPLLVAFSINAVRGSEAPGVSNSNPIGLSSEEAVQIARFVGNLNTAKIFEITGINPSFDNDDQTSKLAAFMIVYFIARKALNR